MQLQAIGYSRNVLRRAFSDHRPQFDYETFCEMRKLVPAKALVFFAPSMFAKFARNSAGQISAGAFYHYIVRKGECDILSFVCKLQLFV